MQFAPNFCFLRPEKQHLCISLDGEVTKDGKFDFARRFLPHSRFRDRKKTISRQIFHPIASSLFWGR